MAKVVHHTPLLKIPVWWRRAVLPSLPWVVRFLSFFFVLPKSCSCRWGPCPPPLFLVDVIGLSCFFFLSFSDWGTASTTLLSLKSLCGGGVPCSHPSLGLLGPFLSFSDTLFHGTWLPLLSAVATSDDSRLDVWSREGCPTTSCVLEKFTLPYLASLCSTLCSRSRDPFASTRDPCTWLLAASHSARMGEPATPPPHLQLSPLVHPSAPLAPPLRPRAAASLSPPLPGLKIGRPPRAVSARLLGPDRTT